MKSPFRLLTFSLAASVLALAGDLTIAFNSKGRPSETHFYSAKYFLNKNESSRQDNLVDYVQGINYSIDHKKKTIQILKWDDAMAAMESLNNALPAEAMGMMSAILGDPNDVSVDDSGAQVVADRTCVKYKIRVAKLNMEICADPKLKPPIAQAAWARAIQARAALMAKTGPMGASFKRLYEEMSKIQGIPLRTQMKGVMGIGDVTQEATKVTEGPIAEATFILPVGYKTEDVGKQMKEEMAKNKK